MYIQDDLDVTAKTWNQHRIRPTKNANVPSGRPSVLFKLPALCGTEDYLTDVSPEDMNSCKEVCTFRELVSCDKDIHDLCTLLTAENDLHPPRDPKEGLTLYRMLKRQIRTA